MKVIVCFAAALAAAMVAAGCATALEKREANLSELRDELMKAESERMRVTLCSGVREDPFAIDGAPGEKREFTVVTIAPQGFPDSAEFGYTLYYGGGVLQGEFSRHPLKNTLSAELPVRLRGEASIEVSGDGYSERLDLTSVANGLAVGADDALKIAESRLKERIREHTENGVLRAEIYVRFLDNPISSDGGYYWYVAFVPAEYEVYAVLIDPATGEIAASRE